jgi:succinate dehydrogenase flavin-adding protein (antitoxin of CptAB toxin-antitoxin module)
MTKLETIQEAVKELSSDELAKLRAYLDELDADLWDAQIERDAKAGKLDKLIAKARADYEAGDVEDLRGT